jgi:2,4-dienoyl-CoA reductase-like NADH-dependent reductase (Old Yellow Enzyme family)
LIKRKGSSTLLVLNQDLTVDEGNELIRQDKIDVAMYGRHWINNPDFQRRIEQGVALATEMDTQSWYNIKGHPSKGYSDYPTAT